jgi:hypothetical protein
MEIGANNAVDHKRNRPTFITPSPDPMADDYGCRWVNISSNSKCNDTIDIPAVCGLEGSIKATGKLACIEKLSGTCRHPIPES